jgi:hypothetical protein
MFTSSQEEENVKFKQAYILGFDLYISAPLVVVNLM